MNFTPDALSHGSSRGDFESIIVSQHNAPQKVVVGGKKEEEGLCMLLFALEQKERI